VVSNIRTCSSKLVLGEIMIEAMVISVDEPQLDRCLVSVRNQIVRFSNIIFVNGVIPEYLAFNKGMAQTIDKWVMKVDGDFILYEDAVERVTNYMSQFNDEKCCCYAFGLNDTFLNCLMGFCCVFRTAVYKQHPYLDKLSNDQTMNYFLRGLGWKIHKNVELAVGTHFDKPSEFQVFRRFYTQWIKYPTDTSVEEMMTKLLKETGDPLYDVGLKAREFAGRKRTYPGSHNLTFDKRLFEEFKSAYPSD